MSSTESWGQVEMEPEVDGWLGDLTGEEFGHATFYIDLLEQQGALLGYPYTSQLNGKLRELRFYVGTVHYRISYYIASGRRIILLTVFPKDQPREIAEVERAMGAMARCIQEGHAVEV